MTYGEEGKSFPGRGKSMNTTASVILFLNLFLFFWRLSIRMIESIALIYALEHFVFRAQKINIIRKLYFNCFNKFWVFLLPPFTLLALFVEMVLCCSCIFLYLRPSSPHKGLQPLVASNKNKLNLTAVWWAGIFEIIHFLNISFSWVGSILDVI